MTGPALSAVLALLAMLGTVLASPSALRELAVGTIAAATVLGTGAVDVDVARAEVGALAPIVVFLVAVLVLADSAAAYGLFTAVGRRLAAVSGGRPRRLLVATACTASGTTAVLSLDATVVLLTPVVGSAARHEGLDPRPHEVACARLANSASLLLPVSNLTNLLAYGAAGLSFVGFTAATAPVWVVAVLLELLVVGRWFRRGLTAAPVRPEPGPAARPVPRLPLVVIVAVLLAFVATSGTDPAWIAVAGAGVLSGAALATGRTDPRRVLRAATLPFAWFVLCWAVVVAAVDATVLGDAVRALVPDGPGPPGLAGLLAVALLATAAAGLLNNLPATLLLVPVVAPLGPVAVLTVLVGVDVGSNALWTSSLANLLWRRVLVATTGAPSPREWALLGLVTTVPMVVACTVVLWAWTSLIGLA